MLRRIAAAFAVVILPVGILAQQPDLGPDRDLLRKSEIMKAKRSAARAPLLAPQPTPSQLLYDVLHYEIDVAINPSLPRIEGRVRMTAAAESDLLEVDVDLDYSLAVASVTDGAGGSLAWTHPSHLLKVTPSAIISEGDTFTIEVIYAGNPSATWDPGLSFGSAGGAPVIYSLSEPWSARSWWPCKDYPDDKATFDLAFSVPANLTATSNGVLVETTDETRWSVPYKRWHWRESYPMTTYLASVTAAVYVRLDDTFNASTGETMPITHYVYPYLQAAALVDLDIAAPSLAFFSETFGLYPFIAEKYGVAICPIGGGMEHQTLTSYGSMLIRGDHYYDWLYVHELAHMWFGDLVTCKDWTHIWLNEGFASYSEALWFEHLQGAAKLKSYMESQDRPASWSGPILRDPDVSNPGYYFNNVVYDKAAWVLHMLRRVMGDAAFFGALRDYCDDPRYRYSVAETADFRAVCEARHGSSLGWFFNQWLTRADRLAYRWSYKAYEIDGALRLTIAVDQTQDSLYAMPVDFRIVASSGSIDTVFWIDDRREEFRLELAAGDAVTDVFFDPGHWVLCDRNLIATDAPPPAAAVFLDQNVPNPFNPATRIRFGLPEASNVSLRVYDLRGALVATLAERRYGAGTHDLVWNGTNARGEPLASGIYFARLEADGAVRTRKLILAR